MDKNPLIKYMMDDEKREDFFHTSRHARVQSGAAMGAASSETFAQRRQIDQNRTRVRKYSDSRLAAQAMSGHERAKVYKPPENNNVGGIGGGTGLEGGSSGGIGAGRNNSGGAGTGGMNAGGTGRASLGARSTGMSGGTRPPMPPMR